MSEPNENAVLPVYTVGYGARSMEDFLNILHHYRIAYLIDLRSAPYSRFKPEFNKDALEARLKQDGVRYVYMGDSLGGQPKDRSCYVDDKVVYDLVREKPFFRAGIERVRAAFSKQARVALMCSEGKPAACHRVKLIGVALEEINVPVMHIDECGELRSQAAVIGDLTEGQLSLFGEPEFRSRKRYRPKGDDAGEAEDLEDGED